MKKRLLPLLLSCVMLVSLLPVTAWAADVAIGNITIAGNNGTVFQADGNGNKLASTEVTAGCKNYFIEITADSVPVTVTSANTEHYLRFELAGGGWSYMTSQDEKTQGTLLLALASGVPNPMKIQISDSGTFSESSIVTYNLYWEKVTPADPEPETPAAGYTSAISAKASQVVAGETAEVAIRVENTAETVYNAFHYELTYDTAKLQPVIPTASETLAISDNNGTLTVLGVGGDKRCGSDDVTVQFKTMTVGEAKVTLTKAYVDNSAHALSNNAPAATIAPSTAATTIRVVGYPVTLPVEFTGVGVALPGEAYTFTAKDKNYAYNVTATMGGTDVEVTDNHDGTFTVPNVTGALAITCTKTAKTFSVVLQIKGENGTTISSDPNVTCGSSATYLQDFSFKVKESANHLYEVAVTIGGTPFTPTPTTGGEYTIGGANITGDIAITVTRKPRPVETVIVSFIGTGAADVEGGITQVAAIGKNFTFSLNEAANFSYTVRTGETVLTPAAGKYTISATLVTGTSLIVTVDKIPDLPVTVSVSEYLSLGVSGNIYRIEATGTVSEGMTLAYEGTPMYMDGTAYVYLVIASAQPSVEDVKAKISEVNATAPTLKTGYDVNDTGSVDINDAQLVYDLYNMEYTGFAVASMERFLRADVNRDKTINVQDAVAVIDAILGK